MILMSDKHRLDWFAVLCAWDFVMKGIVPRRCTVRECPTPLAMVARFECPQIFASLTHLFGDADGRCDTGKPYWSE